ncbi:MAG: 4Fe-4S binding protein [Bacteroidales bacterium]|nr:4Fe-4S binding protein [Bacteroidales bacterium]
MRRLKVIRIFLATLFFVAAVAYLFIGPQVNPMAVVAPRTQIIPSAIAISLGAILVWLPATFLFGRVYCSSVCPVGTLQDLILPIRKKFHPSPLFRWKKTSPVRYFVAAAYLICLLAGVTIVPLIIEPWNIMRNIAASVRPEAINPKWITLGIGSLTGILAGIASLILILLVSFFFGRDFCNTACPIGTGLGILSNASLYQIAIDPDKCTGCLKCEDICPASCIKVTTRQVDNTRCIRCFECLSVCEDDAIRFQSGRNRRIDPLLQKS